MESDSSLVAGGGYILNKPACQPHWQHNYWILHFPLRPSKIHYVLYLPNLSSDLRAHFDGHSASCQANKVVCALLST